MKNLLLTSLTIYAILSFNACSDLREEISSPKLEMNKYSTSNNKRITENEKSSDLQFLANLNLEKLNKHFENLSSKSLNEKRNYDGFPDYYGGAFIDESGKLVIQIKGSINRYKKNIYDIIGNEEVKFKSCKNSYRELSEIMNTIYDFKVNPNNKSISKNFKTAILSDRENLVIIELEDFNILKEKEFKKYVVNYKQQNLKQKTLL